MSTITISFRLHHDAGYDMRRTSLLDAISVLTPLTWDETSSFIHLQFAGTTEEVRGYLLAASSIYRDGRDQLLIERVTVHEYASIGMTNEALFNVCTDTMPVQARLPFVPTGLGLPFASQLTRLSRP